MKKITVIFLLIFGIIACQKNTNANLATSKTEIKKGLLWQISKKGIKTSYLYGTMHTANKRVISMSKDVEDELDKCEVMAGELVIDEKEMMKMVSVLFMQDSTLEMLLPNDKYRVVRKKLVEKFGFMAGAMEKIKPIFVSVMIGEQESMGEKSSGNPMDMFSGAKKEQPLDMYLQEQAKKKGKEVVGLETMEEQMSAFNTISLKEQAEMLYQTLTTENEEASNDGMERMLDLYYEQEIDSLYMMTTKSLSTVSNEKLLLERNNTMVTRMEKIMLNKSLFTAVGAAHLAGKQGLIELLRQKGYKVVPISLSTK